MGQRTPARCPRLSRLLENFRSDRCPARSRRSAGRSHRGCPPVVSVWLSFGLRARRAPRGGVAPEGTALLVVALPARRSPGDSQREGGWLIRLFMGLIPTSCRRRSRSSTSTRRYSRQAGSAPTRRVRRDARQVAAWPARVWAVEGSNGADRPLAQRLLADGEHVVDVPATPRRAGAVVRHRRRRRTARRWCARRAVAVVAVRTAGLRVLSYDVEPRGAADAHDRRQELTRSGSRRSTGCSGCCPS